MNTALGQKSSLNPDVIAKVAWQIWQTEGCQHNCYLKHWLDVINTALDSEKPGSSSRRGNDRRQLEAASAGFPVSALPLAEPGYSEPPARQNDDSP